MGVELDTFFTGAVFTLRQFGQSDIVRHHYIIVQVRIETDSAFYFTCIGKKEDLDGLHELVEQSLDIRCIYEQEMYRTDYWCEIMPVGTSKGAAAKKLKEIPITMWQQYSLQYSGHIDPKMR